MDELGPFPAFESQLDVTVELRVVTANSIWLIRETRYLRLPRTEALRPAGASAALADGRWHEHEGVWLSTDVFGTRLRIFPAGRPPGSLGIYTGDIEPSGPPAGET